MNEVLKRYKPEELAEIVEALDGFIILRAWKLSGPNAFIRPEVARREIDSRIRVWREDGDTQREAGWYWRAGFGVLSLPGVQSRTPASTAEECQADFDSVLAEFEFVILLDKPRTN